MNNSTQINSSNDARCSEAVSVFFTTAMAVITLGALIGNLLVFITVYRNPNLRTSTNYYYFNMAVSDFLASLTSWPLYLTDEIITSKGSLIQGPLATPGCKVGVYVRSVSNVVSILSLVLIAVDRLIATVYPLKASLLSRKIRISLMFATWLIAMGYFVPMFYFYKVEDVGGGNILQICMGRHYGACNLPHSWPYHANYCTVNYYCHLVFSHHARYNTTAQPRMQCREQYC